MILRELWVTIITYETVPSEGKIIKHLATELTIQTGASYFFRQLEHFFGWDETTYRFTFSYLSLRNSTLR